MFTKMYTILWYYVSEDSGFSIEKPPKYYKLNSIRTAIFLFYFLPVLALINIKFMLWICKIKIIVLSLNPILNGTNHNFNTFYSCVKSVNTGYTSCFVQSVKYLGSYYVSGRSTVAALSITLANTNTVFLRCSGVVSFLILFTVFVLSFPPPCKRWV